MTDFQKIRRTGTAALAACLALVLTGCLVLPGQFTSSLDLRKDGTFTYRYDGEIYLLAMSKLDEMSAKADDETFSPASCYDDDTYDERECTADEIAAQKKEWDDGAEGRRAERKKNSEIARAMLGGIDPADPAAAEEFVARLRRQAGWKKVEYKGDGLFDVSFEISGRLDHDFQYPTIEGMPLSNYFVAATARKDRQVRVNAPGFAPGSGVNPLQGMMGAFSGILSSKDGEDGGNGDDGDGDGDGGAKSDDLPKTPNLEGRFTLTTDATILANNTDEGPRETPQGKVLEWKVSPRTAQAPMALIELQN